MCVHALEGGGAEGQRESTQAPCLAQSQTLSTEVRKRWFPTWIPCTGAVTPGQVHESLSASLYLTVMWGE